MAKQMIFSDEARQKLLKGVEQLSLAVKTTLGPKGRNVMIDKSYGAPTITKDGVTVAKEIELQDKYENMGAQLVKDVASKTNDIAGDGTTTATLLAEAIIKEGLKNITIGRNPMMVKKGIDFAVQKVSMYLEEISQKVTTKDEKQQVATISAQDDEVGKIIAEAMEKVGHNGVITVEESQTIGLDVKEVQGMQFDNGYISPYMITDTNRMESIVENAKILVTDKKISSNKELLPILERVMEKQVKDIVLIAEDIDGEALATIVLNKLKGLFNCVAIKAPGFGDRKKEMLKDIAVLTGATYISDEIGMNLDNVSFEHFGSATKIISDKDNTTIVGGKGAKEALENRVNEIKKMIELTESDFDKEKLQERLAKLSGGVAVIEVGAASEMEMKERKHRIEDALSATRAAVEEGIVPGGGVALLRSIKVLDDIKCKTEDEEIGVNIVKRALRYPIIQIAENAGEDGSVVANKVIENEDVNFGFNAKISEYQDLVKNGVIDPKKVTRSALENAASAGSMFLTMEVAITDLPEDKNCCSSNPQMPPMGGMGDMGGMY